MCFNNIIHLARLCLPAGGLGSWLFSVLGAMDTFLSVPRKYLALIPVKMNKYHNTAVVADVAMVHV